MGSDGGGVKVGMTSPSQMVEGAVGLWDSEVPVKMVMTTQTRDSIPLQKTGELLEHRVRKYFNGRR